MLDDGWYMLLAKSRHCQAFPSAFASLAIVASPAQKEGPEKDFCIVRCCCYWEYLCITYRSFSLIPLYNCIIVSRRIAQMSRGDGSTGLFDFLLFYYIITISWHAIQTVSQGP